MADARPKSEYQKIVSLMKEIGSPSGFDPCPPDQHRWHMDPGLPMLQRFWGWMMAHTVHWGHRCAFAVNQQGQELHIEHVAKDLGIDIANAYHTWKKGVDRGVFRPGQPSEGSRRLYITGKVPKFKADPESAENSVQTIFPAHILKQLNSWDPGKVKALRDSLEAEIKLEKDVQAALVAANRAVFTERQDSIYGQYGVNTQHQKHVKKAERPEDAAARHARVEPIRAPLQAYVETIKQFVQSAPKPPVQTTASLLHSETKNQRSTLPVGRSSTDSRSKQTHHEGEKPAYNQHPAPFTPLTAREKQAEAQIFSEVGDLQQTFRHMEFSKERISNRRKSDVLFVHRVIGLIGTEYLDQFFAAVKVQLEKLNKNALGKLPGSAPGPRSLGLILHWAEQYASNMDESVRVQAAEREVWLQRGIAACQAIIEDLEETADAKYEARKWLETYQRPPAA